MGAVRTTRLSDKDGRVRRDERKCSVVPPGTREAITGFPALKRRATCRKTPYFFRGNLSLRLFLNVLN
ncbi:MAG: hypothetical protein QOI22_1287 [Verrucomicrobiota bacterium]